MAKKQDDNQGDAGTKAITKRSESALLAGADQLADNKLHVGVEAQFKGAGAGPRLVITDLAGLNTGAPVLLTEPLIFDFNKLLGFLDSQEIELDPKVRRLVGSTTLTLEAFYYRYKKTEVIDPEKPEAEQKVELKAGDERANSTLLLKFTLTAKGGFLQNLMESDDLSNFFDVEGASVRVLKIPKGDPQALKDLQGYVEMLEGA